MSGVTVSTLGLTHTITLNGSPSFVVGGQTYQIQDVFGIWLLDDHDDFSASGLDFGNWDFHNNYASTGGIAGFKTNPNTGIEPTGSQAFTFTSVNGSYENIGFHARYIDSNNNVSTSFIAAPVPEPATISVLTGAVLMLARRRRRG